MKRLGLFLLSVVLVVIAGCGGGGGGSDSGEFDPTGSEWQFLVTTADAGDTMYTLTFLDSQGNRAASGLFTAVSDKDASYSGTWTSEGYVVTGVSSGVFAFTLNVNADTTTGTVDYVTEEGSGSTVATRTDTAAASCPYTGNWAGSTHLGSCGRNETMHWTATVSEACVWSMMSVEKGDHMFDAPIVGDTITLTVGGCNDTGTASVTLNFSGNTVSGTGVNSDGRGTDTLTGTKL